MKLVHLYGYVSCLAGRFNYWSPWSCGLESNVKDLIGVSITTTANTVLLPPKELTTHSGVSTGWSYVAGYNPGSPELVLTKFSNDPITVTADQELRLWYSQDLVNLHENDNDGKVCCDVYALFE